MAVELPRALDSDVVARVASSEGVEEVDLIAGLVAVQATVSGFADLSVDDIVYEWRTRHHQDPLVGRTPDAYYLDVREHVWDDVLDRADATEGELTAVRAVHAAQFAIDRDSEAPDGAMVLDRP